jgi:hypothetical protein
LLAEVVMSKAAREGFFECVFRSGSRKYMTYVRAWDDREAAELFQMELRLDGIDGDGTVEVKPMSGPGQSVPGPLAARVELARLET